MEVTPHEDNPNKKFDHLIARGLTNTKAYETFFSKSNHFALTLLFHFFALKERDLHYSREIMLKNKLTHTYTYCTFIRKHYITNTPARNPQHCFMFVNSKYRSSYFLNFTCCIKSTNLHGILRDYDPIRQMNILCPLTNSFPFDDARQINFFLGICNFLG